MIKSFDLNAFIAGKITRRKESLLTSDLHKFDRELKHQINDKSVLVIGGAGTIGSSYIKAILKFNVKKLYVVDINENGLTELVRDLRSSSDYNIPEDFKTYPIDFGEDVFRKIFINEGPFQIVANFAAHKHVRSEKDQYSIEAMIQNNVLKAKKLLDLLAETPPEKFFCVSTDKAANPVNIMGASKKLMEDVILSYSSRINVTTARFANVAFSNGSLPLGFLERLNKNQAWSCPLGIKRYFVSPEEAGQICLMASVLGKSGDIFFPKLDMEEDLVAFSDIALDLLGYLDLIPVSCSSEEEAKQKMVDFVKDGKHFPVYFFNSDTTGEKPYEEFYTSEETLDIDTFPNLGVIKEAKKRDEDEIGSVFHNLHQLFRKSKVEKHEIVAVLTSYLPNFEHIEKGKNLDQKM
ncbi:polysaccharide biosynthesis protein [Chitinophaga eiseniae]|uniref:Polysaccharide biosynthesis protein n=1 Tax=Chitinophaga eiseniae TaxID=634771 RepID=A0A847SEJ8_9BACT|nr:polysaccharide biosynthesis protein [Chitinophaga eiseniae]NLR78604.1 polysaccharide biosynthesis protein [Chitinophaga eiseniae]